jgi:hypothetical protein
MSAQTTFTPRAVAGKARATLAKVLPRTAEGQRSLPIRRAPEEIRRVWDDPQARAAVLAGVPAAAASIQIGGDQGEWGTTVTLHLRLETAVPEVARRELAGKAVRRLKARVETGEVPTTSRNPSARPDAGEETA